MDKLGQEIIKNIKFTNQKQFLEEKSILYCLYMASGAVRPKYSNIGKVFRELTESFTSYRQIELDINNFILILLEHYNLVLSKVELTNLEKSIVMNAVGFGMEQIGTCDYVLTHVLQRKGLSDKEVGRAFDEYLGINISPLVKR